MNGPNGVALWNELEQDLEDEYPLQGGIRSQVVSRFPRYGSSVPSLPGLERAKIDRLARYVVAGSHPPIRAIRLIGHADVDTPRRPAVEYQIAFMRARSVRFALARALDRVAGKRALPPYSSRIPWEVQSAGATRLVVRNPRTELDRSRNRRVEISLVPYPVSAGRPAYVRGARFGFAPAPLPSRLRAAIDDFCRRAPNDNVNRCNCVLAVGSKAMQLCNATDVQDRGGIPCHGPLSLVPRTGGRCFSPTPGSAILDKKDYRPPITDAIPCCDLNKPCHGGTQNCAHCNLESLPNGHYLVLKYKPGPLKQMVNNLKCLLDRGCVVPVGVLSGICDDKPDSFCVAPPRDKWRDCWEHWLLVIGYDGDTFVFWDSAESSPNRRDCSQQPCKPLPNCPTEDTRGPFCGVHFFGVLFYDSKNNRLSTANTDPSIDGLEVDHGGFHTQGIAPGAIQKRYQVVSMSPGLPWRAARISCNLGAI